MSLQPDPTSSQIRFSPIGSIQSLISEQQTGGFAKTESLAVLEPQYGEYLVGLEDYSHLHVIYWLSEMDETHGLHRPQANPDVPVVGMFACRCPQRPNPVGLTLVELISIEGTILRVRGLDAIDGTPVIDIKPYYPPYDVPKGGVRVPDWIWKLKY